MDCQVRLKGQHAARTGNERNDSSARNDERCEYESRPTADRGSRPTNQKPYQSNLAANATARSKDGSSSPARQVIAIASATFSYDSHDAPQASDCIFKKGDEIHIFEVKNHHWWIGKNVRTGSEGVFPSIRVRITKGFAGVGVLARARSFHDFKSQQEGDLGFLAGATILVTELAGNDWWKGKLLGSNGFEGMFPRNYVLIYDKSPAPIPTPEDQEAADYIFEGHAYTSYNGSLHVGLSFNQGDKLIISARLNDSLSWGTNVTSKSQGIFPHACVLVDSKADASGLPSIATARGSITTARALLKYDGTIAADLSFEKGDPIQVRRALKHEILWGRNTKTGAEGLFPDAFIAEAPHKMLSSVDEKRNDGSVIVTALYSWPGESKGDLAFIKFDKILLIMDDEDWCEGQNKRTGATGIFPRNHVRFPGAIKLQQSPKSSSISKSSHPGPTITASLITQNPTRPEHQLEGGQSEPAAVNPTPHPHSRRPKRVIRFESGSRLDTDLVRDSKLETSFTEKDVICHTSFTFHPRNRSNRIVLEEKWKTKSFLGRGGFGQVDLQECIEGQKKGELRAVKKIIKQPYVDDSKKINYDRELEAIAKFSHEKFVHCFARSYGWYEDTSAIFITMEYFENGDLQKHMIGRFPEFEVGHIVSQLLEGLSYMHGNGFAHRDLKPANILVKERSPNWWVKISDFGISKRMRTDHTGLHTMVGSPRYLAPDVLGIFSPDDTDNLGSDTMEYTVAVDQWALGAIAFHLLTSRDPFPEPRSLHNYISGKKPFPSSILEASRVSKPCIDFLQSVLAPVPSRRPEARLALQHPWLEDLQSSSPDLEEWDTLASDCSSLQFDTATASASWTEVLQESPDTNNY